MLTIQEVISKIHEARLKRDFLYEMTPANSQLLKMRGEGTFEAVYTGRGEEKCLIPEVGTLHFLYRGQNEEHTPCAPSLYRGNRTEAEIFLERMRFIVFRHLLDSHPVVEGFFKRHHFVVDYEGMAQHYGLQTSILDLTSSIDTALFFAVCKYNNATDSYEYFNDGQEHDAVLYVFCPAMDNEPSPSIHTDHYMSKNIRPIGLQAFPRPGAQQGYALHIAKGNSVKAWMYRFTFTCEDSKHYYDLFKAGEAVWIKDVLVPKTKMIARQTSFSFAIFDETFNEFRPKGFSKTKLKQELMTAGVSLSKNCTMTVFTEQEREAITREWNDNIGPKMADAIRRKPWFEHEGIEDTGDEKFPQRLKGIHNRTDYRTLGRLGQMQMLIFMSAPDGPDGAEWVNYTDTPRPQEKLRPTEGRWQKIPASSETLFGKPYLQESDWKI